MYNKNMTKRASNNGAPVSTGINKVVLGFTIIETMLFLAIAGLIFAGLVAGTNGAIRQQRYKDSVQGFVDDLRDLYSLAENTQVLNYDGAAYCSGGTPNEGRGRSDCSVYGILAVISPQSSGKENVEARWVVGLDQAEAQKMPADSDKEFMQNANVTTLISNTESSASGPITAKSHSILWGADVNIPCETMSGTEKAKDSKCSALTSKLSSDNYAVMLFIYRSPMTGSINTLAWLIQNDAFDVNFQVGITQEHLAAVLGNFDHRDVSFCVSTGAGMSYNGGLRMITVSGTGSNSNAVRLIEADSEENKCNG